MGYPAWPAGRTCISSCFRSKDLGWFACFRIQFLPDHIMIHSCLVCWCVGVLVFVCVQSCCMCLLHSAGGAKRVLDCSCTAFLTAPCKAEPNMQSVQQLSVNHSRCTGIAEAVADPRCPLQTGERSLGATACRRTEEGSTRQKRSLNPGNPYRSWDELANQGPMFMERMRQNCKVTELSIFGPVDLCQCQWGSDPPDKNWARPCFPWMLPHAPSHHPICLGDWVWGSC